MITSPTDLAQCTTLLIDLTLGEHLQTVSERRRSMCKGGICDTQKNSSRDEIANLNFFYDDIFNHFYAVRPGS